MKKQMTAMDLGIVFVAVIVAIIALSVSQQFARQGAAPNLPAIERNSAVVEEYSAELAVSSARGEGEGRYNAVVLNPATGAEIIEWNAPSVSSLNSAKAEGTAQYSTVVVNPATGQAEAVEYAAPRLNSLETAEAPETSMAAGEGQETFRTVVINPETGAQVFEWQAPTVSSLSAAEASGEAQYSTVVVDSASGKAEVVKWQAPKAK